MTIQLALRRAIVVLTAAALALPLSLSVAFADEGRGGGDGDRGNSGPGNSAVMSNSGPNGRDDDGDDDRGDRGNAVSTSNSGPGSRNSDDDDDDDRNRGNVFITSNAGPGSGSVIQGISRGSDEQRFRVAANGRVDIRGAMITSISTSNRTLQISVLNMSLTVDTTNARLEDRDDTLITLAQFAVGNEVRVEGAFSPATSTTFIMASKVVNRSIEIEDELEDVVAPNNQFLQQLLALLTSLQQQLNRLLGIGGADTVAPVISNTAVSGIGSTTATITWTTNEAATSKVFFSTTTPVNLATANSVSDNALVLNHSLTLTNLAASTTIFFVVQSQDVAGNVATSPQGSFTTGAAGDTTAPTISSIFITNIGSTTASVLWTTNEPATSKVFFSTTTPLNLATASSVTNNALVLSHSLALTGLTASTTAFVVVQSQDAAGNTATSSEGSFTTAQ